MCAMMLTLIESVAAQHDRAYTPNPFRPNEILVMEEPINHDYYGVETLTEG